MIQLSGITSQINTCLWILVSGSASGLSLLLRLRLSIVSAENAKLKEIWINLKLIADYLGHSREPSGMKQRWLNSASRTWRHEWARSLLLCAGKGGGGVSLDRSWEVWNLAPVKAPRTHLGMQLATMARLTLGLCFRRLHHQGRRGSRDHRGLSSIQYPVYHRCLWALRRAGKSDGRMWHLGSGGVEVGQGPVRQEHSQRGARGLGSRCHGIDLMFDGPFWILETTKATFGHSLLSISSGNVKN